MGGGSPDDPVASPWLKNSGVSSGAPDDCLATDSVARGTSEVPLMMELNGASSQSPRPDENDAKGTESYENTEADDTEGETATVTSPGKDAVASEVQTVKADDQDLPLDSQPMIKQHKTVSISNQLLMAEIKGIYAGLLMIESKCMQVDAHQMPSTSGPLDVTRYLSMIPDAKLVLLQDGEMQPDGTVRTWFIKAQKDLPATPGNLSTTPKDCPTTPEEASAHPNVSDKTAPQVCSPEDYLRGFQVALELRAKEHGWPEYEELAALTTADIGEEGRKKVMDRKYLVDMGCELVDQLLRDLEIAKAKADQEAAQAEEDNKDTADTAVGTVALTNEAEPKPKKNPMTKRPLIDNRPLHDKNLYKKVGKGYWMLVEGQWIPSLNGEQYAALIAIHRTLLHEHSDFFIASQHPIASEGIRRLGTKYSMPARMWNHGIFAFLEVMRKRLVESQEFMDAFIILAYNMMSLLDETVPGYPSTWVECKADLARYGMATQRDDISVRQRWSAISKEEYTRALGEDPTIGRIYHHLAILERPTGRSLSSPNADFDATVSQLFYYTKSLVVKTPYLAARETLLVVIGPIVAQKSASVPQTDKGNFLAAVAHLILASLKPETLRAHGHKDSRDYHVQAVYAALEKLKIGGPAKTSRIRPSAQLGLLLCQLLLGIPLADKRWSPMMAAWAPDLVTAEDRADSDAMANARDIHDATIEMINTMVPYLLEEADTRDLRVWGFIYVILVFMRSLKTRPNLLERFGSAFHAKLLAPFLNMLLREDETRGGPALKSASQSELVTICSLLNERKKPGKYEFSTEDNIRTYHRTQEEQRKVERAKRTAIAEEVTAKDATATLEESTATTTHDNTVTTGETPSTAEEATVTTEETTNSDAAHEKDRDTKTPGATRMYANLLPEHCLLSGLFFAREAELCDESPEVPTKDAVVVACPPSPEASLAAVQTAEESAVEQAQEVSLTDSETDSEAQDEIPTDPESESEAPKEEQTKVGEAEKTQQEDKQKVKEAEEKRLAEKERKEREAKEAEVRKQEGLLRDPPLFPKGWFKRSKYDSEEIQVRTYVQDAETYNERSIQILRLAAQLTGDFFIFEMDEEGRHWISVPGASSVPKPDPNKKMPEIMERDGGVRVVYVHPSFHTTQIEREKKRMAREEERQKEKEKKMKEKKEKKEQKEQKKKKYAKATADVATTVDEKAEGDAEQRPAQPERPINHVDAEEASEVVKVPAGAPSMALEDDDNEPISAADMEELKKTAGIVKASTAAEKPSSTHEAAEHTEAEAEAEMTLPVQGVDDELQETKGSDAGPDAAAAAAAATASGDDQVAATVPAEVPATETQATVQLTEGALDVMPRMGNPTKAIKRWRAPGKGTGVGAGEGGDEGEGEGEGEDGWTHVSDESHGDAQTAQVDARSMISRFFFG